MEHSGTAPVGESEQEWAEDRARFVAAEDRGGLAETGLTDFGPLAREFAGLTGSLLAAGSIADVLARVVGAARRVIPAADLVSVTLRQDDGSFHTPIETGPAASDIDQAQYRSGLGPCVAAARADGPALAVADDLRIDPRWPEFAGSAVRHGYLSVLACSLVPDCEPPHLPGALNVYAGTAGAFTPADRDRLLLLSTHASLALATCAAVSAAELQETQLRQAVASRDVIGQAKGILMARRGMGADEAFDVLRRTSQDLNVKLVELAGTVTAHPDAFDGE
ncbi:GAF and ANTAR domain-containing protein [Pseudonocardia sp. HH130630-07]|uniref:GAF and ANTAR domain-containing protein n=1 Tax=Pseudonocardia sp. HH130630-07 TaxID=1690815 RepID=UPI001E532A86|nr:GAF and ANTAR domain-containing protein [Pseudonocardia sp. HH130630-07]